MITLNSEKSRYEAIFDDIESFISLEVSKKNAYHNAVSGGFESIVPRNKSEQLKWLGAKNVNEVKEFVHEGWESGVKQLTKLSEKITTQLEPSLNFTRNKIWKDFGEEIDMQRVYSGQLDRAWLGFNKKRLTKKNKTITLYTRLGGNCNIVSEELFHQGATCLILTDILEKQDFRVEIVGWSHVTNLYSSKGKSLYTELSIKKPETPVNLNSLASVVALAGFYRVFYFKAMLSVNEVANNSLGQSVNYLPADKIREKEKDTIYFLQTTRNEEEVVTEVKRILSEVATNELKLQELDFPRW